jgi:hypothetical protein
MKFGAKKHPTVLAGGSRFAPNFIQNLYTVLKIRLWESPSTLGEAHAPALLCVPPKAEQLSQFQEAL